ncbi:hypothetical protein Ddc_00046 [Ditylenchus destructor]|nr:hypothetical protein Ddc_00046 [Ditylenchus destructor]
MDLQQPSTSSDYRVAHTYDTNRQNGHFSDESSKQETDELSEHSLSQENLAVRNMQSNGPLNVNKQNWNWTLASSDNIESSSRLTSTHPSKFNITVVPGWLPEGSVTCEATSDATIGQLWSALAEQIGMHTKYLQLRHLGSSTILDDGDMTWAEAGIISGSRIRVDIMILCAALKPFSLSSICAVNSAVRPEISHGNDENVTITVDAVPLDTMDKTNHVNDVQRRCSRERGFSPNVHPDETYDERRRRKQREEKRRQRARKAAECRLIDAENLRRQMAIRPSGMNGNTPTSNGNMNPMTHFGEICERRSVKRVRAPSPNAPAGETEDERRRRKQRDEKRRQRARKAERLRLQSERYFDPNIQVQQLKQHAQLTQRLLLENAEHAMNSST